MKKKADKANHPDYVEIFTMFITIKGKRVYRANGRPFNFYAKRRK
jgi:hypothetical protein